MSDTMRMWADKVEAERRLSPAVIVDIDGTIAQRGDRQPYDFSRVSEDQPFQPVIDLVWLLEYKHDILFVTARSDECYDDTSRWLEDNLILDEKPRLYMRKAGDSRHDYEIKDGIYEEQIRGSYDVKYVLDDREGPVRMWRGKGLVCLQVADGENF